MACNVPLTNKYKLSYKQMPGGALANISKRIIYQANFNIVHYGMLSL